MVKTSDLEPKVSPVDLRLSQSRIPKNLYPAWDPGDDEADFQLKIISQASVKTKMRITKIHRAPWRVPAPLGNLPIDFPTIQWSAPWPMDSNVTVQKASTASQIKVKTSQIPVTTCTTQLVASFVIWVDSPSESSEVVQMTKATTSRERKSANGNCYNFQNQSISKTSASIQPPFSWWNIHPFSKFIRFSLYLDWIERTSPIAADWRGWWLWRM